MRLTVINPDSGKYTEPKPKQPIPKQALVFTCLQNKSFDTVGNGEIACNGQFHPFPAGVFYPFGELSAIFIKFELVICKLFQFGRV